MKKKKLLTLIGSICLSLVLAALLLPACAPVEVAEEVAELEEEIADLEDDVAAEKTKTAAEKAKVSDLEDEIAALKKPVEVIKIIMEQAVIGGWYRTASDYIKEDLEKGTDGRIQVEVVEGEAIVPTAEQLDALRDGIFDLIFGWTAYYESKIPFLSAQKLVDFTLRNNSDIWALYYKYGWNELAAQEYAKYNVQPVAVFSQGLGYTMYSVVDVPNWDALRGLKIRTAGFCAEILEAGGASTVWIPSQEIYTALASGLIDAATFVDPATGYSMGFHEVTNYWIRPSFATAAVQELIANADFWSSLSEADKALIHNVMMTAGLTRAIFESDYLNRIVLDEVQKVGVELIYWDDQSLEKKSEITLSLLPDFEDPAAAEAKDLMIEYMRFAGYID